MATSDKILDTATTLLQERGFNAFSYHDIARELKIKTSSIHYHFPAKRDLGRSIMSNYRAMHKQAMTDIDANTDSPLEKLNAFADLFICTLGDEFLMCPCAMLTTDIADLPESIRQEVKGFFTDSESWLTSILKDGLKQGILSFESSPSECAKMVFAAFEGAMLSARAFEDKNRLNRSLKQVINLLKA